ncbi:tyrosine-type recombinase/integrase [Methyloparacoccus murrellii]
MTDRAIQSWIRKGERFEGRADGGGLYLSYRENFKTPVWRFRYRLAGKARVMVLGSYADLPLAEARRLAKSLRAKVALGHDPALEKQDRIREVVARHSALTVNQLADDFYNLRVKDRLKRPDLIRNLLERDIRPCLGNLRLDEVKPRHIDRMLRAIAGRGAPTTANDVLSLTKRLFAFAVVRQMIESNPAIAFEVSDAGGKEKPRDRALSRPEIVKFLDALQTTTEQNRLTFKLLLMLGVRKQELAAARVREFDLEAGVWRLPVDRSKTAAAIEIPLPGPAVEMIRELIRLGCSSHYLLPARKSQHRMLPHISESTLNVALTDIRAHLPDVPHFTVHDLRRTCRTQLAALGIAPHVAERCLNHKLKGMEGVYDAHDYFEERRDALNQWAALLGALERGEDWNVTPLRQAGRHMQAVDKEP